MATFKIVGKFNKQKEVGTIIKFTESELEDMYNKYIKDNNIDTSFEAHNLFVFKDFLAHSKLLYPTWLKHERIVQCRHVPEYSQEKVWQMNYKYNKNIMFKRID